MFNLIVHISLVLLFYAKAISCVCPGRRGTASEEHVIIRGDTQLECTILEHCNRGLWYLIKDNRYAYECNNENNICQSSSDNSVYLNFHNVTADETGYYHCRCEYDTEAGDVSDVACYHLSVICPPAIVHVGKTTKSYGSNDTYLMEHDINITGGDHVTIFAQSGFELSDNCLAKVRSAVPIEVNSSCFITSVHRPSNCSVRLMLNVLQSEPSTTLTPGKQATPSTSGPTTTAKQHTPCDKGTMSQKSGSTRSEGQYVPDGKHTTSPILERYTNKSSFINNERGPGAGANSTNMPNKQSDQELSFVLVIALISAFIFVLVMTIGLCIFNFCSKSNPFFRSKQPSAREGVPAYENEQYREAADGCAIVDTNIDGQDEGMRERRETSHTNTTTADGTKFTIPEYAAVNPLSKEGGTKSKGGDTIEITIPEYTVVNWENGSQEKNKTQHDERLEAVPEYATVDPSEDDDRSSSVFLAHEDKCQASVPEYGTVNRARDENTGVVAEDTMKTNIPGYAAVNKPQTIMADLKRPADIGTVVTIPEYEFVKPK